MIIDFVGKFYDNHSLSIINRNLAIKLAELHPDWEISITPLDSYDPEYRVEKNIVKQLIQIKTISLIKLLMSPLGLPLIENNLLRLKKCILLDMNLPQQME